MGLSFLCHVNCWGKSLLHEILKIKHKIKNKPMKVFPHKGFYENQKKKYQQFSQKES